MALPPIFDRLRLPVIGSPLFIVSGPDLVIAQCKAGVVGSEPRPRERRMEEARLSLQEGQRRVDPVGGPDKAGLGVPTEQPGCGYEVRHDQAVVEEVGADAERPPRKRRLPDGRIEAVGHERV